MTGGTPLLLAKASAPLGSVQSMFDDATKVLKDALYVTVGLGVIAFQKAQVQRVELQKAVEERLRAAGLSR